MSRFELHLGDCLETLRTMPDNSVDSIVTDPPYGLSFMGKKWDYDVPSVEIWAECLRVLKPGGHLLAFAGTRTQHRMAVRIEDAGFEIRDLIMWCYGSGFPKSLDVSKAIDRSAGAVRESIGPNKWVERGGLVQANTYGTPSRPDETTPATEAARQWQGWGTALKPALEPITVARKPLSEGTVAANVLQHGTGALNIDGCRVGIPEGDKGGWRPNCYGKDYEYDNEGQFLAGVAGSIGKKHAAGRWPANFCHDGSEEVLAGFPQARSAGDYCGKETEPRNSANYMPGQTRPGWGYADSGSAARFFYCAKASKRDRDEGLEGFPTGGSAERDGRNHYKNGSAATNGSGKPLNGDGKTQPRANTHPTVKPTDLMAYLVRLVTPPGGTVLDPFMGSGSTGKAAMREGFRFIGCEMSPEYLEIARARIESALKVL